MKIKIKAKGGYGINLPFGLVLEITGITMLVFGGIAIAATGALVLAWWIWEKLQ
jgi:hypothetical protein